MRIFDVLDVDIHGGSIRIFVGRADGPHAVRPSVARMVALEEAERVHDIDTVREFAAAVEENRVRLRDLLYTLKHQGARIAAVSAPAKGMTLLNYARIGTDVLDFATEKSSLKIGRFTPGSDIPIVSDGVLLERRPQYALLLAWNFAEEIMRNLHPYTEVGGRFIVPIPIPHVVDGRIALEGRVAPIAERSGTRG
jgi:hypothetical protein